jgi:2-polyprenyl-3-methyl-5-hydroxy-6-metoxy-1,4-benzoquinol methylase
MDLDKMYKYMELEIKPCIVCGKNKFEVFAKKEYLTARKCKKCGMVSVNPYYTDKGLEALYSRYLTNRLLDEDLKDKRSIMYDIDRDWILNYVKQGNILDIGSSAGYFLSRFNSDKFTRHGVEFSSECKSKAKELFNIPIRVGNFVEMDFDVKYDLVMLRGVIEHFNDPISVIRKISRIISKGGYLYITATPNGQSFAFDVYREKWSLFSVDHVHFFSVKHLNDVMKRYGFSLVSHHYQYEETPYANPENDFKKIKKDISLIESGDIDSIDSSVPFMGSMLTAAWKFNGINANL